MNARHPHRPDAAASIRIAVFAAAAIGAATYTLPPQAAGVLWTIGLFAFGMPHGAYDLAALQRAERHARTPKLLRHGTAYVAVMIGCLVAYVSAPSIAASVFLLVAAHHFGTADSSATRGRVPRSWHDHLAGFAFGLVVISAPLAFQPVAASQPFAVLAALAQGDARFEPEVVAAAGKVAAAVGLAGTVATILRLAVTHRARPAFELTVMLFAVIILSATAPPLLAVGLYFLLVHAPNHCATAVMPGVYLRGHPLWNTIRVHGASTALLVPSILIVLLTAWLALGSLEPDKIALSFLLFCLCATLPHHLMWLGAIGPSLHRRSRQQPTQRAHAPVHASQQS